MKYLFRLLVLYFSVIIVFSNEIQEILLPEGFVFWDISEDYRILSEFHEGINNNWDKYDIECDTFSVAGDSNNPMIRMICEDALFISDSNFNNPIEIFRTPIYYPKIIWADWINTNQIIVELSNNNILLITLTEETTLKKSAPKRTVKSIISIKRDVMGRFSGNKKFRRYNQNY